MEVSSAVYNHIHHETHKLSDVAVVEASSVAVTEASYAQLTHRNEKQRLKRRVMRPFEKRYSNLAHKGYLVPERKRIDYVLVYHGVRFEGERDEEKKKRLRQQERNRNRFEKLMKEQGFSLQKDEVANHVYVKLHCPFKRLCYEAEKVKLEMPLKDCKIPQTESGNIISQLMEKYLSTDTDVADFVSGPFCVDKIDKFEHHEDPTNFFRPAIRSLLVNHILINLDIRSMKEVQEDMTDSDDNNEDHLCCCPDLFSSSQKSKETLSDLDQKNSTASLKKKGLPYLLLKGAYSDAFVLHDDSEKSQQKEDVYLTHFPALEMPAVAPDVDPRKDLDEKWAQFYKFQPMWHIRNYFGEKIAFYFAWTGMLITTLWIPMLFGLAVFFYGLYESVTESLKVQNSTHSADTLKDVLTDIKKAFDNDVTPFFALFICCWGTIFLEAWKRERATLAYEWDVDMFESNEPDRPQFFGTKVKKDPVTQEDNWFYPFRRQVIKFTTSCSVLFIMVAVVIMTVVAIIVYRVIMDIDYCPQMTNSECFLVTTVASSIFNAISILVLGKLYEKLAGILTDWENHRTQTKYDDALIIKLFVFQFVNSYASCFYIAFFRGKGGIFKERYIDSCEGSCMTQLSFQILVLMVVKPIPKFFKDIIIPFVTKLWHARPQCCQTGCLLCSGQNQVKDIEKPSDQDKHNVHMAFLERERLKPSLGDFTMGEYTEKVILYGFLMLFASSFPLAPLLALAICYIDIRVDAKRMLWWYRRPVAYIAEDIGMWFEILNLVNFVGVITNAFIIAFTSNWGKQFDLTGKLWVVIGFEHLVFLLKYLLAYLIPDVPQDIRLAIRREKYLVHRKLNEGVPSSKDIDFAHLFPEDLLPKNIITEEEASANTVANSRSHDSSKQRKESKKRTRHWKNEQEVDC
ncbi:unnamed protein product [Candidula unifasciata]|uniref:Anoctamin n=1 Tax=Candidula unifasciata TaxID=100452 RepID=A0A8S4A6J9_9EUPU|nr:unnamed protein product [Candidula unifasciata]